MAAIVANEFRIFNASNFMESLTEAGADNIYLFIAKADPWETGGGTSPGEWAGAGASDTAPPSPIDTTLAPFIHHDDIVALKRITGNTVKNVIKRVDWVTSTVYPQYDDITDDQFNNDFFVLNSELNVYKCIYNNGGANSVNEPTGTASAIQTLGDGYKWKFIYEVQPADIQKFLTNDWIPVQTLGSDNGSAQWTSQQAAVDGAINHIEITTPGTGYSISDPITIGGDGSSATAEVLTIDGGGGITSINITAPGTGYRNATATPTIGSGAVLRAIVSPLGGHGSDAVRELGGYFVMINVRLEQDEGGDFPTNDDFRKLGIIVNPTVNVGGPATATTYTGAELDDDTGQIIYVEYRRPINRDAAQTESIHLVIEW